MHMVPKPDRLCRVQYIRRYFCRITGGYKQSGILAYSVSAGSASIPDLRIYLYTITGLRLWHRP